MQALKSGTSATAMAVARSTCRGAAATPAAPLMPGAPRSLGRVLGGRLRAAQPDGSSGYPRYPPPPPAYQPVEPSAPDLPPGTPAYGSSYGQSDYSASYAPSTVGPSEEEQAAALEQEELRKVAGYTRGLSHAAFWVQFALAIVSGGILLFSAAFVPRVTGVTASVFKYLTLAGVIAAFVSALFAHGFLRLSKKLQDGGVVGRGYLVTTLLTNNAFCLGGIAITVIGLQASVGTLVAKSLTTALAGPYQVSNASSAGLVSLDVFALQASTNTLLCHVIGLVFTNLMLRAVNKVAKAKAA